MLAVCFEGGKDSVVVFELLVKVVVGMTVGDFPYAFPGGEVEGAAGSLEEVRFDVGGGVEFSGCDVPEGFVYGSSLTRGVPGVSARFAVLSSLPPLSVMQAHSPEW